MSETCKRGALRVDKILKRAMPGELPFEQPTRFETCHQYQHIEGPGLDDSGINHDSRHKTDSMTSGLD
jgi:hypothetical protein